jgi:zinc protease
MMAFRVLLSLLIYLSLSDAGKAIKVQELTTKRGIKVWLAQDTSVPIFSIAYSFEDAGSAHEEKLAEGRTLLASELLLQGAGNLSPQDFKEKLAELGVTISFSADLDYFRGFFRTTLRVKDAGIALLKDVLYSAHLEEKRLEILRSQAITSLQNKLQEPAYIAGRNAAETLYKGHPYAQSAEGIPDSLLAISVSSIRHFLQSKLALSNLKIAICGNLSKQEASEIVDQIFSRLPDIALTKPLPPLKISYSGTMSLDRRTYPQSNCLFYHPGLDYSDPNYLNQQILAHILGGDVSSRLTQDIREKNGLAYTVETSSTHFKLAHHLEGYVGTENAKINETIHRIQQQFSKLDDFGVTAQELKHSQEAAIGSFVLQMSSTKNIARQLLSFQERGRPVTYIDERTVQIRDIKLKDLNDFLKHYIEPKKVTFFVVGNPQKG